MASFGVHLAAGISASGLAAASVLAAGFASPAQMLAYLGLGTLGSLLPDLDADNSSPVRIGFTLISITLAFLAMFPLVDTFPSVAELVLLWLAIYLLFRWLVFALFTRLTRHRGVFHSLPAAALFGMLTAILGERLLGHDPLEAWIGGGFVAFGYLLHLLLDELYSVNLFGVHTRRSLGSACKLWSPHSHAASVYLYSACLLAFVLAPDHGAAVRVLSSPETYARIAQRLLPQGGWFRPAPAGPPLDGITQPAARGERPQEASGAVSADATGR